MSENDRRARAARGSSPFLTMKQTAFHLGLSLRSLQRLNAAGKGPRARRHGGSWRFHIEDIEAWSLAGGVGGAHD